MPLLALVEVRVQVGLTLNAILNSESCRRGAGPLANEVGSGLPCGRWSLALRPLLSQLRPQPDRRRLKCGIALRAERARR